MSYALFQHGSGWLFHTLQFAGFSQNFSPRFYLKIPRVQIYKFQVRCKYLTDAEDVEEITSNQIKNLK